jgi:hypothetical protein
MSSGIVCHEGVTRGLAGSRWGAPTLHILRSMIARGSLLAPARPVMAGGPKCVRALGMDQGGRRLGVRRQSTVMVRLLRVRLLLERLLKGVDLALQLGNAAIGLLLSFSSRRRSDAGSSSVLRRTVGEATTYHCRLALRQRLQGWSGPS